MPFLREMDKGQMTNPVTGVVEARRYVKSYGCDGGNDYGHLITMRSATPAFYDKRIESGTINISGPRSGCTNSIIPANGVLNMPYFYAGCSCSYPLPTGARPWSACLRPSNSGRPGVRARLAPWCESASTLALPATA